MRRIVGLGSLLTVALLALSCQDQNSPPTDPQVSADVATSLGTVGVRGHHWLAPLRTNVEVPAPTVPPGPQPVGVAGFEISRDRQSIFYQLIVARIQNVHMAHIHLAPPGETGPVVVWLYPSGPPPQPIPGEFNGVLAEGVITAANLVGPLAGQPLSALLEHIRAGNAYVNVHTLQNAPGEIRGQIFRIDPPDSAVQ
jgi:hypothetical protein